jgi:hypothetical protein
VPCICGGRYSVHVAVEYIDPSGRVEYASGRFCYINDALIDIGLPADAIPLQATIYDWHEPGEIIRITFTRPSSDPGGDVPGEAEQGALSRLAVVFRGRSLHELSACETNS